MSALINRHTIMAATAAFAAYQMADLFKPSLAWTQSGHPRAINLTPNLAATIAALITLFARIDILSLQQAGLGDLMGDPV